MKFLTLDSLSDLVNIKANTYCISEFDDMWYGLTVFLKPPVAEVNVYDIHHRLRHSAPRIQVHHNACIWFLNVELYTFALYK